MRTLLSPVLTLLGCVFCIVLAPLFHLHSKQELFHSPKRCVFSLKERDDREQNIQRILDQLLVALIEFAPFDAIDESLDLGRIGGRDIIVVFHRRRSRRSHAKQKRTPRPERKYFLFSRWLIAVIKGNALPAFHIYKRSRINSAVKCSGYENAHEIC